MNKKIFYIIAAVLVLLWLKNRNKITISASTTLKPGDAGYQESKGNQINRAQ